MKAREIKVTVRILAGVVFLALLMPTFALAQKDEKSKDEKKEAKQIYEKCATYMALSQECMLGYLTRETSPE